MKHGGRRPNAGRKSKGEKQRVIKELNQCIDEKHAFKKLAELIDQGSLPAIKLYLQYRYGKPKQIKQGRPPEPVTIHFK